MEKSTQVALSLVVKPLGLVYILVLDALLAMGALYSWHEFGLDYDGLLL